MLNILVRDIMVRSIASVSPNDNLKTVAHLLRKTRLDGLPVIDSNGKLVGIMTKANLYDAIITGVKPSTPITKFFTRHVLTFHENMPYKRAAEIVHTCKVGSAVVINDKGDVTGVVSKAAWVMAMFKEESWLRSQLQAIYESIYNGLIVVDSQGIVTMMNPTAEKTLKTSASIAVGKPASVLLPNLGLDEVLKHGRNTVGIQYQYGKLTLLCNISPIVTDRKSAQKYIAGAVIIFQDLTDLERAVAELEYVKELYETLNSVLEIAYDGIIVIDNDNRITLVNKSMADFLRVRPEEVIGKPITQYIKDSGLPRVVLTGVAERNQLHSINGKVYVVTRLPIIRKGRVIGAVGKIIFQNTETIKELAEKLDDMERQLTYYRNKSNHNSFDSFSFDQIITCSPQFLKIKEEARLAALGKSNILIVGESGTGKELLAQAIHKESGRKGPLIKVNCAAIPETLLESEFFGYVSGAFTGARKGGRAGKLALAHKGTLFLDEIGDMPISLQSKLLRVLQDRCFEPVGSDRTVHVDLRIISATNRDLEQMVQDGDFRNDLYYRLNVIRLDIPPLRYRQQDIKLLTYYFIQKYNEIFGVNIKGMSKQVEYIFLKHSWPGNVRELENVVERALNFVKGDTIEIEDLPLYLRDKRFGCNSDSNYRCEHTQQEKWLQKQRERIEKESILAALRQAGGNKAEAARILGISRSWLYTKMARAGISTPKSSCNRSYRKLSQGRFFAGDVS